jgi:hypothetical protein
MSHVATQKGAVSVGNPHGRKPAFIAACTKSVTTTPNSAQQPEINPGRR